MLDVLSAGAAVRSVETESPTYLYAAADELADFGAVQSSLEFRIRQIGWTVASGIAATAAFSV